MVVEPLALQCRSEGPCYSGVQYMCVKLLGHFVFRIKRFFVKTKA